MKGRLSPFSLACGQKGFAMNVALNLPTTTAEKLDHLADLRNEIEMHRYSRESLVNTTLQSIADQLLSYDDLIESLQEQASEMESYVKSDVLSLGCSFKGSRLHAVWSKPRVSWDAKGLDGYAVANPAILAFRKEGEPSVSIREVKA
jgi:hypothetical protein